ncbi:MAG: group III truncated hemoglobin [Bradyrhizobium sp.]
MARDPPPRAPGLEAGVTEPMIHDLVHAFYARVREDALLGPVFSSVVADWDAHLSKMCAFWSSVTLLTGRYKGTPMQAHAALPQLAPAHFQQWLAVFRATAAEVCPPHAAALFIDRADRIAESLQMGIAIHRRGAVSRASASGEPTLP